MISLITDQELIINVLVLEANLKKSIQFILYKGKKIKSQIFSCHIKSLLPQNSYL